MLHFKITIEVVETGATKTIEREGIENTLDAARKFMWESLPRLTPLAPDAACGHASSDNWKIDERGNMYCVICRAGKANR